jgi:hypothetical protein
MRIMVLLVLVALVGCQDADVVTADGKSVISCSAGGWAKCVSEACLAGFDVLRENRNSTAIIKCKPVEPGCPCKDVR